MRYYKRNTLILVIMIVLLIGCSNNEKSESSDGIVSYSSVTSLGGEGENINITVFAYSVFITNENNSSYVINSIEPILSDEIVDRLEDNDIDKEVNKSINSKETIELVGEIRINTKGMTKQEIMNLTKTVTDYKISLDTIIKTRKNNTKN